jgi:hypothetical protein
MRLKIDNTTTIESDYVEAISKDESHYYLEMVSGRVHEVSIVMYQTIDNFMRNSGRINSQVAY